MVELNEPQVWTLIGVFAASTFALMGVVTGLLTRTLRAEIGGMHGEMTAAILGLRAELRAEIGGLRGEMNARFERMDVRFDHLDRDVQALTRQVFGRPE